MTPERWRRIDEAFASASRLPASERGAFLATACAGDPQLVTSGVDGTYRIWDATTGIAETVRDAVAGAGHGPKAPSFYIDAKFSPDGTRLLTQTSRQATLWRVDRGPLITEVLTGDEPHAAALSPDATRLAVVGSGVLGVWEVASGRQVATIDDAAAVVAWDVNWRPDGAALVVAANRGVARVYRADGGLEHDLRGHDGPVYRASFSPDGAWIATAGHDRTARIWDAATGAPLLVLAHPDRVMSAGWSADGRRLVTGGWDHRVRVWDAATGALLQTLDGGGFVQFLDATFSPDGRFVAAGEHGGVIDVWELASERRLVVLSGHAGPVTTVAWSPDGALLASSADEDMLRIWDVASGRQLATRRNGNTMSVTWTPDGTRLVAASIFGAVRIWDVHRADRTLAEIDAFIAAKVPFRLEGTKLVPVDGP